MSKSNTRHYVASDKKTGKVLSLIEAATPSAVRNHISRNTIEVRVASTKDMAAAFKDGTPIEVAGEEEVPS